jgi:hypothetical protein
LKTKIVFQAFDITEAEILRNLLLGYDIESDLADDGMIGANPLLTGVIGGVKIIVAESDFEQADALIREFFNSSVTDEPNTELIENNTASDLGTIESDHDSDDDIKTNKLSKKQLPCPKCGSIRTSPINYYVRNGLVFLGLPLFVIVNPLRGIIIWFILVLLTPFLNMGMRCKQCKHHWS